MAKPGEKIPKAEFEKMKNKWEKKNPGKTKFVKFGREILEQLLSDPKADTINIYFGETDDDTLTVMLAKVDASGTVNTDETVDKGATCPPVCN
jgi:hypothetical protein